MLHVLPRRLHLLPRWLHLPALIRGPVATGGEDSYRWLRVARIACAPRGLSTARF